MRVFFFCIIKSKYTFKCKGDINMKTMKNVKIKTKLNFEDLRILTKEGKNYLVLSELHNVFGVKPAFIANASARVGGDFVARYIKKFVLEDSKFMREKKCLDIEGLPLFLKKLSYKFEDSVLNEFANHIEFLISQNVEKKAKIVEFKSQESDESINISNALTIIPAKTINDSTENSFENKVNLESSDSSDSVMLLDSEVENSDVIEKNKSDITDITDIDSVLNIMDGVLSMLEERSILKSENDALRKRIQELEEEIDRLDSALKNTNAKNNSILKKATLIRDYVLQNK